MAEPWNLSIKEWSNVLESGVDVTALAEKLKKERHLPWMDTLLDVAKNSQNTLDLGSGRGELSAILAIEGKETTLFDWSNENLEASKKLYQALKLEGKFYQGDMTKKLPFKDTSFDTVYSCGVFEYFSDEEILNIIDEMKRVARKSIIILVPNAKSLAYRLGKWYMEVTKKWQWGGERPFSTLKPYFKLHTDITITELTVGTKHSLGFLKIPGGRTIQKVLQKVFQLKDHSRPAKFNQGYILITIAEKTQ